MFDNLMRAGNYGANVFSAGANVFGVGFGVPTDPRGLQAMTQDQMAEYVRRQGDPRNVPISLGTLVGMKNAWRPPVSKPSMTLAEYDARRAAFRT